MKLILGLTCFLYFHMAISSDCWLCDRLSAPRGSALDRMTRVPESSDAYKHTKPLREAKKTLDEKVLKPVARIITPPKKARTFIETTYKGVKKSFKKTIKSVCHTTDTTYSEEESSCPGKSNNNDTSNQGNGYESTPELMVDIGFLGRCIDDANSGKNIVYVSTETPCYNTFNAANAIKTDVKDVGSALSIGNISVWYYCFNCLLVTLPPSLIGFQDLCKDMYQKINAHNACFKRHPIDAPTETKCYTDESIDKVKTEYKILFESLLTKFNVSKEELLKLPSNHDVFKDIQAHYEEEKAKIKEIMECL